MIPLHDFKNLLGVASADLTDEEIERIREVEYGLADAIFERWLRKHNGRNLLQWKSTQHTDEDLFIV
jgi:hypothetical protein